MARAESRTYEGQVRWRLKGKVEGSALEPWKPWNAWKPWKRLECLFVST